MTGYLFEQVSGKNIVKYVTVYTDATVDSSNLVPPTNSPASAAGLLSQSMAQFGASGATTALLSATSAAQPRSLMHAITHA